MFAQVLSSFLLSQVGSKIILKLTNNYQYKFGNHLWKFHHWNYMEDKHAIIDINFKIISQSFTTDQKLHVHDVVI